MYEYKAIIKKIYDADTVTVDIDLGFGTWLVILKTFKDDKEKYGRWLGEIFVMDVTTKGLVNINEQLIAGGYAVRYME